MGQGVYSGLGHNNPRGIFWPRPEYTRGYSGPGPLLYPGILWRGVNLAGLLHLADFERDRSLLKPREYRGCNTQKLNECLVPSLRPMSLPGRLKPRTGRHIGLRT